MNTRKRSITDTTVSSTKTNDAGSTDINTKSTEISMQSTMANNPSTGADTPSTRADTSSIGANTSSTPSNNPSTQAKTPSTGAVTTSTQANTSSTAVMSTEVSTQPTVATILNPRLFCDLTLQTPLDDEPPGAWEQIARASSVCLKSACGGYIYILKIRKKTNIGVLYSLPPQPQTTTGRIMLSS